MVIICADNWQNVVCRGACELRPQYARQSVVEYAKCILSSSKRCWACNSTSLKRVICVDRQEYSEACMGMRPLHRKQRSAEHTQAHVLSSKKCYAYQCNGLHWAERYRACEMRGLNSLRYVGTRVVHGRGPPSVIT